MTTIKLTAQRMIDPIAALVNEAREDAGAHPVALVAMDIGITLTGGLAVVETKRSFRNDEAATIEALLSLPVPVHAAFFGLTAKIDGRILKGIAQAREEARETYEEAVSEGKTAVLHEELLRGVHALSVGNLAPGGMIEVTTRWADTLRSAAASCGRLRIPMTVGDVYGISDLPETDELTHGDGLKSVSLRIRHDAGAIRLATGALRASRDGVLVGEAPANAPIDIEFEGWKPGVLKSKAWDGRDVSLHIEAAETGEEPVHAAVLVDHSGSMSSRCEGDSGRYVSKHEAVRNGLRALTEEASGDRPHQPLGIRQHMQSGGQGPCGFARSVRKSDRKAYAALRRHGDRRRHRPRIFAETDPGDVLLITDGKSYALDVHRLAQEGRRIFVVLVGEDSLEANVGHLAALTGGDIHFSFGADVDTALHAALQGMRTKRMAQEQGTPAGGQLPESVCAIRGNVRMSAAWSGKPAKAAMERDTLSEGVAAYAANLALPSLSEATARKLAVGESLVTHLTSLVLVDEEGPLQEGLPVTRKVNLPTPRTAGDVAYGLVAPNACHSIESCPLRRDLIWRLLLRTSRKRKKKNSEEYRQAENLYLVTYWIDWKKEGAHWPCNLNGLEPAVAASPGPCGSQGHPAEWGIDPVGLAIALVAAWTVEHNADWDESTERHAGRVRRSLLKGVDSDAFGGYFRRFDPEMG